jgi:4-amino-4-deoxy-L-arabinose transferase-like glycosyltransferase
MVMLFRLVYASAAFLSIVAGTLVTASLFIADRAPQSVRFLVISLVVTAVFLGMGLVLFGIQRHFAAIAAAVPGHESARELARHMAPLVVYLLAGGAFVCVVLGSLTYAILERIDQGFAVFG